MQVSVLASGSKGNSVFIEIDGVNILIDAGISARRIKKELAALSVDVSELAAIFITHEHRDHISGLVTLLRQYNLPVYSRKETFQAMYCLKDLPEGCCHAIGSSLRLGGITVKAFNISHDAADPVGYMVEGSEKCTVATDLGFVTSNVQEAMENSDILVLEANHDPDMLKRGSYPRVLQQRILGSRGHLSNSEAAWALARLKHKPQQVLLAHLSEQNNKPELARDTIQTILDKQGECAGICFQLASQTECVSSQI